MTTSGTEARSRGLAWLGRGLGALALFVLLLVALYVGAGRYLMTQIGSYEADLEGMLSERLGRPVQIDHLAGAWVGLDPVILVAGLRVGGPEEAAAAAVQRVRIRLATFASLVRGRLAFSELSASDADLTLTQDATGGLGLEGLWEPAAGEIAGLDILEAAAQNLERPLADRIRELGKFLVDPVLRIADLRLTVRTPDHSDQYYRIPLLDLAFQRGIFSAAGRLTRADGPGSDSASTNTETVAWFTLSGSHFLDGRFDGVLYLDVRSTRLVDTLLQRYQWLNIGIDGLDLGMSAWLTFEDGSLARALASVKAPYLQLRTPGRTQTLLEDLEATLTVRPLRQQQCAESDSCDPVWEVQAQALKFRRQGQTVGPVDMQWHKWAGSWKLAVDTVPIERISELMADLEILPPGATDALRSSRPRGEINRLTVDYAGSDLWRITADLHQVAIAAFKGAPLIQGLDGWIEHTPAGGRVLYDSGDITLGLPELFSAPWQFEHVTGDVAWLREGDGWRIRGQDLRLRYSGETILGGDFELSLWPDRSNTLDVRVGVLNGKHEHVLQFFPVGVVGGPLYDWLSMALEDGEIPWGWYYGSGPIQADNGARTEAEPAMASASQEALAAAGPEPETEPEERFTSAMVYDFDDVELVYAEDWPAVQQGRGRFHYLGERAWVDIEAAEVAGLKLQPSQVFVETDPVRISINTGTAITGADLEFWMASTPLGEGAADLVEQVDISGAADLNLGLVVFPGAESKLGPLVDARLALQGLSVVHPTSGIQWRELTGTLGYDSEKGLSSQGVRGYFLNHEVRVGFAGGAGGRPAEIHQWGQASVLEVNHQLAQPLPFATGEFDYDLRASVGEGIKPLLGFQLDLQKMGIGLPSPLTKEPGTAGNLQGNLVAEDDGRLRVQGNWQDRLAFQLLWHEDGLEEASVVLAGETAPLRKGEYFLGGSIDQLVVEEWMDALAPLVRADAAPGEAGTRLPPATERAPLPFTAELSTGQLSIGGYNLGPVDLRVDPAGRDWRLGAAGPRLTGVAVWREEGPHWLELEHLALPGGRGDTAENSGPSLSKQTSRDFPDADVRIQQLQLGDAGYGSWQFELRSMADALAIRDLRAQTGSLAFEGQLIWHYDRGEEGLTHLSGKLEGGNIQDLNAWLQAGVPLNSKSTGAEMDLSWSGSPPDFSLARLEGEMALGLKDGTILDQNNVAQVFRIFGILNADTLLRRLRLDFSDLYQAGVSFEGLSGRAVVKEGILTLDPELQLSGPSGAFRLTGSTHLIRETLDMRLVVILPLTQNLPVAALLLGAGAPIGGALFILDKLLGDPLSKLTSATYDVSGNWEKPEVKLRNIFDTGSDSRN